MERAHPGLVLGALRTVVTATIASLLRSLQRFLAVQECLPSTVEGLVHRSALGRHGVGLHSVELSVQLVEGTQVGLERGELGPIELASIVSLSQSLERCVAIPNGFTGTAVDLAERSLGSCGGAELSLVDGTSGGARAPKLRDRPPVAASFRYPHLAPFARRRSTNASGVAYKVFQVP
jgi:hypothetical protein